MQDIKRNIILSIAAYAVMRDVDPVQLFQTSGVDYKNYVQNKHAEINCTQMDALCANSAIMMEDELFGLHFGESMQLAALGIAGQIIMTSQNIEEALKNILQLTNAVAFHISMSMMNTDNSFSIQFVPNSYSLGNAKLQRHMTDFLAALFIHELDGLTLKKIRPSDVMVNADLKYMNEYQRVLRCDQISIGKYCQLTFDRSALKENIITADKMLQGVLLKNVNVSAGILTKRSPMKQRIYHFIYNNAYLGLPSLEKIASNLNMSSRHLQRLLREEGSSFQEIADEVNKLLAIQYLKMGNYSIKEISAIMGYQEVSGFTRAFTRWTGMSPRNFLSARVSNHVIPS